MPHDFSDTYFNEPCTVLGVSLINLSLDHFILLQKLGSPFVSSAPENIDKGDLIALIVICSRSINESISLFSTPKKLLKLSEKLGREFRDFSKACERHDGETPIQALSDIVSKYLSFQFSVPPYTMDAKHKGERPGTPFWKTIITTLQSKLGLTEEQILNRSYRRCMEDMVCIWESVGLVRVKTVDDIEHDNNAALYAKYMAEAVADGFVKTPETIAAKQAEIMERIKSEKEEKLDGA